MTQSTAEIYDLDYQHYDGPREGRVRAVRSLWVNSFRTVLGLGRGARAKILPGLMFLFVITPAAGIVLIASISGDSDALLSHEDYYSLISIFLLLFSAIIAPEVLIPDRREGVISLYLVRPLTIVDYVAARWSAFAVVAFGLALSGQTLLLIGFLLAADNPAEYLRDNWLDIPRFVAGGAIVALFITTIPMAVSAFTTRRAYAAAFVIAVFVITSTVAGILTAETCTGDFRQDGVVVGDAEDCDRVTGDFAKWFSLLNLSDAPIQMSNMIFDKEPASSNERIAAELNSVVRVAWYALLVVGPGALLLMRYRRMSI